MSLIFKWLKKNVYICNYPQKQKKKKKPLKNELKLCKIQNWDPKVPATHVVWHLVPVFHQIQILAPLISL